MFLKEFFEKKKCAYSCFLFKAWLEVLLLFWAICSTGLVRMLHYLSRCIPFIIRFFVKCDCKTLLDRVS